MAHFRYRQVEIPLEPARPRPEQIETGLNVLTDQGWRVVSLEVDSEFSGRGSRVRVLVEQVEEEALDPVA
jgi:hypothetical protein